MSAIARETTVGQVVAERPVRARVFEELGIDYCCGGKKPLADACAEKGLDVNEVVRALMERDATEAEDGIDWTRVPLSHLTDHIVATHHAYMKQELPRLAQLVEKVLAAHGDNHPELHEVREVFYALKDEIEMHLMKEEQVLFPMIVQMEATRALTHLHCGTVGNPIRVMEMEHDSAGQALARLRELTQDYTPPADACNTYRVMLDGLESMEHDLHQHIHKENNILHPRAAALEAKIEADQ